MYSSETTGQQFIHSRSFIFEYYRMQRNIKNGCIYSIYIKYPV